MAIEPSRLSVILPACNEERGLKAILPELTALYPGAEVIVVSDGSIDGTEVIATQHGAVLIKHPYRKGNGAAIKSGARAASGSILIFMDSDGQHNPHDIEKLLGGISDGFDMVVGSRRRSSQASVGRWFANSVYNWLASRMVKHRIDDLTSGFRAVDAELFRRFLYLLPNGFSYPTTITMAFFRSGYSVGYRPVVVRERYGKSHIRPIRDGVRFLVIMFRVCTLFSPLRLFGPISALFFAMASAHYIYSYVWQGRFTNMSALLYSTSVIVFLIGLISEQITLLIYKDK